MNNDQYTSIKIEDINDDEQVIILQIYDLPYIFIKNTSFVFSELSTLIHDKKHINTLCFLDLYNKTIGLEIIKMNKCYNYNILIVDIADYNSNEKINLKPEVGYEIINKLKEIFGDKLNEE